MKGPIMAALVVSCGLAFAQGVQPQEAPKEHSMTGCLKNGSEPNSYIITDVEGKGPKTIGIVSSTADLTPRRSQDRDHGHGRLCYEGREGQERTEGRPLHEGDCHQNDLGNLPVVARSFRTHSTCPGPER
jgi:hypothetical protein